MSLPGRQPRLESAAQAAPAPGAPPSLHVEDDLRPRVRMPADLLRCVLTAIEVVVLGTIGLIGVQVNAGPATRRLPVALLGVLGFVAYFAIYALPLALAAWLVYRRQWRRLAEAVATGAVVAGVVEVANIVLRLAPFRLLYEGLAASPTHGVRPPLFDGYLAGLVAYITVVGLAGRPKWRAAFWFAIGFYTLTRLGNNQTTLLAALITLLIGSSVGSGLRFAFGSVSERPSARQIAGALSAADAPIVAISRVWDTPPENRRYRARTADGEEREVTVYDRDQQAADILYRIYRRARVSTQVSRSAPFTMERAIERNALLIYSVEDAGVATPRLRAALRVGSEAAVLSCERMTGTALNALPAPPSDDQLASVWDAVLQLHERRVTHRSLTADRILLTGPEHRDVILLDPGNGDVAASEVQLRLDLAQLLAELALLVGPERSARVARDRIGDDLGALVPLLQPVALHRSTRAALRRHRDVLPALRKQLSADSPGGEEAPPVQLERFRLRTVVTLVIGVVAADILVSQLTKVSFSDLMRHADWRWSLVALCLSAVTYFGATWSLTGYVPERLSYPRTFLAQLAGSFVTLVAPAAVGGVALNLRYLRKSGVSSADAAASVGVSQVFAFALHLVLLLIFVALTGTAPTSSPLRPHVWVYFTVAGLVAAALVVLAIPAGRRFVRSRLASAVGQVLPRLMDVAQQPARLAEGIGGALLLTATYIACLDASVRALGGHVPLTSLAVVYLAGSALGSIFPTPGGLGGVEAALSAGLTAAGLPGTTAVSAVLLFRTLTFWLPVPVGWVAMNYLVRRDAL